MLSIVNCYRFLNKLLEKILLFEQSCILCHVSCEQQICADCYTALPWTQLRPACPICRLYLTPKEIRCSNCSRNNFHFNQIICGFEYAFPLDKLLHHLKYQGKIEYSRLLSHLFWAGIAVDCYPLPDLIIAVPLHRHKQQQRGFNQVDELLREFSQRHPEVRQLSIKRHKETVPQATLKREERIINLAGAFFIDSDLKQQHIAIVDDVVTTATTVNELAQQCRRLGAKRIDVWCLMRTQITT